MRLAILASGFADYSVELARAAAVACDVRLFADANALARESAAPAGLDLRLFRQDTPWRRWGGLVGLLADLARFRPQAILAHEHAHPHLTALLRGASRIAPLGLIVHDPEPHPGRDHVFAQRRRAEIAAQRALAARLFTHGLATADRLHRLTGREVVSIPHGPILRPVRRTPPPGRRRVLMFGRMEAYKGLDVLLEACRALAASPAPPIVELRGEGPDLARLETAFRTLETCEVTRGFAGRGELLQALAACDLVLAPYRHASGSGVAAAAQAHGRGLVASAVGGLAEAVRPGLDGVLVPPGDPVALAHAIETALPQAAAFGAAAADQADGPLAWSVAAATIRDQLAQAAGLRSGA